MRTSLFFVLVLLSVFSLAQETRKMKVTDAQDGSPVAGARLICRGHVLYTNDDGEVLVPENSVNMQITSSRYQTAALRTFQENVALQPLYQNIESVAIRSVDIKKLFQQVMKNYTDLYDTSCALYDMTFRQKSYENDSLRLLMIADGKFWTRDGLYNARDAFRNRYSDFMQLQADHIRYLKNEGNRNPIRPRKQDYSKDYVGDMFFNYELSRMIRRTKMKNAVSAGKILYENGDSQYIYFTVKTHENLIYKGYITYNTNDGAISYFEMTFDQNGYRPYKLKDENGTEYEYQLPSGTLIFDFYKQDGKYVPTKISVQGDGTKYLTHEGNFEYRMAREMILRNFRKAEKKGLEQPVDIIKAFWTSMKVSEDKGYVLLSEEEKKFISEN